MATGLHLTTGWKMRIAREAAGLSVEHMAVECGVARQTIGNYEHDRGRRTVPRSVLKVYADECAVPLRWLEEDEPLTLPHPHGKHAFDLLATYARAG